MFITFSCHTPIDTPGEINDRRAVAEGPLKSDYQSAYYKHSIGRTHAPKAPSSRAVLRILSKGGGPGIKKKRRASQRVVSSTQQ